MGYLLYTLLSSFPLQCPLLIFFPLRNELIPFLRQAYSMICVNQKTTFEPNKERVFVPEGLLCIYHNVRIQKFYFCLLRCARLARSCDNGLFWFHSCLRITVTYNCHLFVIKSWSWICVRERIWDEGWHTLRYML